MHGIVMTLREEDLKRVFLRPKDVLIIYKHDSPFLNF